MLYCSVLIRWNCGRNGKINNLQICICSVSSSLRNQPGSKSSVVWGFFYKLKKKFQLSSVSSQTLYQFFN